MAPEDRQHPRASLSVDAFAGETLAVEVAYATPARQVILRLQLPPGTTVAEAIDVSGVREQFAEIGPLPVVGIFSCKVPMNRVLASGDRVEIYRPLLIDPKQSRRQKAELQKSGQQRSESKKRP